MVSYNYAGGQLLRGNYYTNCIRTEAGYCRIQWKESSTSSPDSFAMSASPSPTTLAGGGTPPNTAYACPTGFIYIPELRDQTLTFRIRRHCQTLVCVL